MGDDARLDTTPGPGSTRRGATGTASPIRWLWPLAALLILGGPASCGKLLGRVPLSGVGATGEAALQIPEGTKLEFPVYAEKYSYSGQGYLVIDVALLRDQAVVARMSCRGFEFEGGAGSGCGVTHANSDCALTAPAGGATSVRASSRMEDPAVNASFEGLAVEVRAF